VFSNSQQTDRTKTILAHRTKHDRRPPRPHKTEDHVAFSPQNSVSRHVLPMRVEWNIMIVMMIEDPSREPFYMYQS
jgi:hypothetical protein